MKATFVAALVLALSLSACGGGGDDEAYMEYVNSVKPVPPSKPEELCPSPIPSDAGPLCSPVKVAVFVEVKGQTHIVMLHHDHIEKLLTFAATMSQGGVLPLAPTNKFSFRPAPVVTK